MGKGEEMQFNPDGEAAESSMRTYRSKIGLEIIAPIVIVLGVVAAGMAYNDAWGGGLVILAVAAFIAHVFSTTEYTISGTSLRIKSGVFVDETIDIGRITTVAETRDPTSAPALSLDRLAIAYNARDSIMVSPRERSEFVEHLTRLNPGIVVKRRKNNGR